MAKSNIRNSIYHIRYASGFIILKSSIPDNFTSKSPVGYARKVFAIRIDGLPEIPADLDGDALLAVEAISEILRPALLKTEKMWYTCY